MKKPFYLKMEKPFNNTKKHKSKYSKARHFEKNTTAKHHNKKTTAKILQPKPL